MNSESANTSSTVIDPFIYIFILDFSASNKKLLFEINFELMIAIEKKE